MYISFFHNGCLISNLNQRWEREQSNHKWGGRQGSGRERSHKVCCGSGKTVLSVPCLRCKHKDLSLIFTAHILKKIGCDGMCFCAISQGGDMWGSLTSLTSLLSKFQAKGRACLNKTKEGSI